MTRIDLQQFCPKEQIGARYYIAKPWRVGSHTFATNGHICVRVDAADDDEEQPSAPNAARILELHPSPIYAPLRVKLPPLDTVECATCYGRGFYWENEDEDGEPDLKNPGAKLSCEDCDGSGRVEKQTSVSIAGVFFAAKYIAQIAALPEAEFPTNPVAGKSYADVTPCPFRFAGGIGALMPMTSQADAHLGDLKQFETGATK